MSAKGSITTSDYLDWYMVKDKAIKLLDNKKERAYGLYILLAINTDYRMGDILGLKYEDLANGEIEMREEKTNKVRTMPIPKSILPFFKGTGYIFVGQKGNEPLTPQQINRKLKQVFAKELSRDNLRISSHSLRKTFGREYWNRQDRSEEALTELMENFNHTSMGVTKTYLGITKENVRKKISAVFE